MSNKIAQDSILERLGLKGVDATPFTLKWLENAFSDENCTILRSMLTSFHIGKLNSLTKDQIQILESLPKNHLYEVDEEFKDAVMSANPMHIAMTLIGYKLVCNECGTYIVNEDALLLTTDDGNDEEICPHCHKSNGLMDLFLGEDHAVC
jgi:hypothetical protein